MMKTLWKNNKAINYYNNNVFDILLKNSKFTQKYHEWFRFENDLHLFLLKSHEKMHENHLWAQNYRNLQIPNYFFSRCLPCKYMQFSICLELFWKVLFFRKFSKLLLKKNKCYVVRGQLSTDKMISESKLILYLLQTQWWIYSISVCAQSFFHSLF